MVAAWWKGGGGILGAGLSLGLAPAEAAFRGAVRLRNTAYDKGLWRSTAGPIPVISVGNLTVGGTGKTPIAAWVATRLREMGRHPAIVLRGYGEDEVAVHAELNPGTPIHRDADRLAAVVEARRAKADCAVIDDGFQHRRLRRDLDIVLVSAEQWTAGSRRLLPRGPWREPSGSLARATHVVVTRKSASLMDVHDVLAEVRAIAPAAGHAIAHLAPAGLTALGAESAHLSTLDDLAGQRLLAVTTLAEPEPFVAQLRAIGADVEMMEFGDHHEFTETEIERIASRLSDAIGVVTRKEAVKLRGRLPAGVSAVVVEQRVIFESGEAILVDALERVTERNG